MEHSSEIILYQTSDGKTKIDVRLEDESVWLNQSQLVELFQITKQNFQEGELHEDSK